MAIVNKVVFKVKMKENDTAETELCVRRPSQREIADSQRVYNLAFRDAVQNGAFLRPKIEAIMREQNLWDDDKEKKLKQIQKSLSEGELKLAKGGVKKTEARKIAVKMRADRISLQQLLAERNDLDANTAESQAHNARFNYFVSVCTKYNSDGSPVYGNYDDFKNKAGEEYSVTAAYKLMGLMYGVEEDYEKKLPENKFLLEYKFVDDKLRLINSEGKLVDDDGKLIDESGFWVDAVGARVDKFGNLLNEDGTYKVDFVPFLDG